MTNLDDITRRPELLDAELARAGAVIDRDRQHVRCPFHDDQHGSMGLFTGNDGKARFKCQACGAGGTIIDARALAAKVSDSEAIRALKSEHCGASTPVSPIQSTIAPSNKPSKIFKSVDDVTKAVEEMAARRGGKLAATYIYDNPETAWPELLTFRIEFTEGKKQFTQSHAVPGGFVFGGMEKNPIYRRAQILDAQEIVVVEGEKCVHRLEELGIAATTSPGGAKAAEKADWGPLSGRRVTLWPDADEPGAKYADDVVLSLAGLHDRPVVRRVEVARLELPVGGDVVDFAARYADDEAARLAIRSVIDSARPTGALADLQSELDDAVAGRRFAVALPWPMLSNDTRALLPGTVVVFCGSPGATKSLALIQALRGWIHNGVKAAVLELEDGAAYHLRRALAQISENSNVTDDDWCRANAAALSSITRSAQDELHALESAIEAPTAKMKATPPELLDWIERKASAGCRILCIDPITLMVKGQHSWTDDETFLFGAKKIVERHGASLILVSHPRKLPPGAKPNKMSMDDLAGGVAYSRFSQTILFLAAHPPTQAAVRTTCGNVSETINRTLTVFKARNGRGVEARQYGFIFDSKTLTLKEAGEITE
jgi:hypothetical protein